MAVTEQTIEEVVAMLHQAAEENRRHPCRQGNIVSLSNAEADEAIIGGDLHGNRLNFQKLLGVADLANSPKRHLIVQEVCHGGPEYPGGGCMSHLLLEDVARQKVEHPRNFHFLLSNHELS